MDNILKIESLDVSNFKRLRAAHIKPDGSLVVVGGANGAGKSSALDAVFAAIGGKDALPAKPLRKGEKKGHVEVDLGEYIVRRTFTEAGGGTLTVKTREGAAYSSPQAILDKLYGALSFDPIEFARMEPKKQAATLRALVGLDTTKLDADRKATFDQRTEVNRKLRELEAVIAQTPHHNDAPEAEVSAAALMAEMTDAQNRNAANAAARRRVADLISAGGAVSREITSIQEQIVALQEKLDAACARHESLTAQIAEADKTAAALVDDDLAPIRARIEAADGDNAKVRANAARAAKIESAKRGREQSDALTAKLDAIDTEKAAMLAAAKFPVDGMGFDEDGVTLDGLPFEQASSAQKLRASVAMGLALNPRLRVLLVRDGSLLDSDSLAMVAQMAADADAQVWVERVGHGDEVTVLIEDGAVAFGGAS